MAAGACLGMGSGFCTWKLVVVLILCTMVNYEKNQPRNSISRMRTAVQHLDGASAHGMAGCRNGIAGLAAYNPSMLPWSDRAIDEMCNAAEFPRATRDEPNDEQTPRQSYRCLARNLHLPWWNFSPVWTEDAAGWHGRTTLFALDFKDNCYYHSGNFNHGTMSELLGMDAVKHRETKDLIQYHSGNLHGCNYEYHAGNFDHFHFQCNSGNFDITGAIDGTACRSKVFSPGRTVQFQFHAGDNFCIDSDFQDTFAVGLHERLGTTVEAETCQNIQDFMDYDHKDNFSSADGDITVFGSTTADRFFTLVMVMLTTIHNGLQCLAECTSIQLVIVAISAMILVCCGWYWHLQLSHLSYHGDCRARVERRTQRRVAI